MLNSGLVTVKSHTVHTGRSHKWEGWETYTSSLLNIFVNTSCALLNMCFVSLKSPAFKFPRSISWHEVKRMLMLRPWKTWIKLLYESSIKLAAVLCRLLYQSACHTTAVLSSPLSSHSVSIQLVSNTFTILDYPILTSNSLPQHCERYHLNHHQLRRRRFYIYIYFKKNNQRTFTFFCCSKKC